MAPLEKAYFAGQEEIPDEDVKRAEVANFTTGPAEALKRFGWKGSAAGCVGLRLTATIGGLRAEYFSHSGNQTTAR
jgi:hypothetical protein